MKQRDWKKYKPNKEERLKRADPELRELWETLTQIEEFSKKSKKKIAKVMTEKLYKGKYGAFAKEVGLSREGVAYLLNIRKKKRKNVENILDK